MAQYVLGISCYYHDASATLLKDGEIVAAAEEERFTRTKHDVSFPSNAIRFCLEEGNIGGGDLDHVGFYEKPFLKFERVLSQYVATFPRSYKTFLTTIPSWFKEKLRVPYTVRKRLGYHGDVLFIPHHIAHAASAYLPSPFQRAAIVTVDGVGEWTTTAYGLGEEANVSLWRELRFPHSIGLLYSTITAYLGFTVNNSEYKIMSLAAYGEHRRDRNEFYQRLRKVIDIKRDGSFRLDMSYFAYHYANRMPGRRLCTLLKGPVNKLEGHITDRHKDIAAAVQLVTEDILLAILDHTFLQTQADNLVLAGGVALNSVFNGKILRLSPFERVWIQPNASDGGTSMGVALYIDNCLNRKRRTWQLEHAYLGPGYSDAIIKDFLITGGIRFRHFTSNEELVETVAHLIFHNAVVGWFQGKMEWGPRALGGRSLLANPCNPQAQELLNTKVKHRERFRPFAPSVCVEDAATFFEVDSPLPKPTDFMLMVYPVRRAWRSRVPAITHVDGTARVQTVQRAHNPRYYDLIKAFGKLSGVPMLVNTSFNIRGEPIVCTPHDAYRCMMGTEIDFLVLGNYLVRRLDNLQHMWDSAIVAHD